MARGQGWGWGLVWALLSEVQSRNLRQPASPTPPHRPQAASPSFHRPLWKGSLGFTEKSPD